MFFDVFSAKSIISFISSTSRLELPPFWIDEIIPSELPIVTLTSLMSSSSNKGSAIKCFPIL